MLHKESYQSNNKCFTKAFLLLCLSLLCLCSSYTAKALSCSAVWPYVFYDLDETVSQPSDSTLFNPKITVKRSETISSIKCTESLTLKASECKYTDSGFYRYCARFAEPDEHGNDYACNTTEAQDNDNDGVIDTEATVNCNYNDNGESSGSDSCPNCRCNCSQRICAYDDMPGSSISDDFFEPEYGTPGYDNNGTSDDDYRYCCITPPITAYYQPYHKDTPNPCCGTSSCGGWGYDPCGDSLGTPPDGSKINANANHLGCVDIPLGPYPPPLCDPIQGTTPAAGNMNICMYSPDYELNLSSSSDNTDPDNYKQTSIACSDGSYTCESVCEFSTSTGEPTNDTVYSTFEKPLVRIYFENILPLCESDYVVPNETPTNDNCVQFLNSDLTAEQIWKDQKSLLPVCDYGKTGPDCFSFPSQREDGPSGSSTTFGTDYKYFKTYYHVFGSDVVSESKTMPYANYSYGDDYSSTTISLAGLYDSYYEDMTDNFNMDEGSDNAYKIEIVDYTSKTRNFLSYLNLGEEDDEDGMTLCVYEDIENEDNLDYITCVPRPKMFPPIVYPCLYESDCKYPNNIIPYEQPRISFDVGSPAQSGIIGIDIPDDTNTQTFCVLDNYHTNAETKSSDDNTDPCTVYKAKIFSAYLTDDDNYQLTSDDDGTVTPYGETETYQGGMQYVNNVYCRGATKICLTGYSSPKVVISKIVPLTTVDSNGNETVTNVASNVISDRVIPPPPAEGKEENYPLSDDILYNPTDNDWYSTSSQPVTTTYFGYLNQDPSAPSDSYIAKSYCDTGKEESASYILCTANNPDEIPDIATDTPSDDISCVCSNEIGTVVDDCSTNADPNCEPTYSEGTYSCTNDLCQFVWKETVSSDTNTLAGYKYTDSSGATHTFPIDSYMKRTLNNMELAQCVEAAQPFCDAISGLTESSSTAEDNGYANWPKTNVDNETEYTECIEGRQPRQDDDGNDIIPTRYCRYIDQYNNDGTAILKSNGCPEYTISFVSVDNGCVKASLPDWWPSKFLTNNTTFQGAIFNQFNIAPDYKDIFVPASANYNPYINNSIDSSDDNKWIEKWYTATDYNSCKRYGGSRTTTNTKRDVTDGDQEMLHLRQEHWEKLWNDNDLTWLLVDSNNNNGCWVYDLGTSINATNETINRINDGTLIVGMKICKYKTRISFSLVDLAYNSNTDYKNIAYIMQSNIISYDAYTTKNVSAPSNVGGFTPKTKITDNDLPNKKSKYHTYLNHGIVVDQNGFDPFETDEVVPGPPPFDNPMEIAEEVNTSFFFSAVYKYDTQSSNWDGSKDTNHYWKYAFSSPASCGDGNDDSYSNSKYSNQKNTDNYPSCALSQYRGAIEYPNSGRADISAYLPSPTNINPNNYNRSDGKNDSYVTRMYFYSCYGESGGNRDSPWPYQNECLQDITIGKDFETSGYTYGNSARNVNMFLWKSDRSYDVCNNE